MYKFFLISIFGVLGLINSFTIFAKDQRDQGIYIHQGTMENTQYLQYLITKSKEVGINTFVVDFNHLTRHYQENVNLIKQNGIKYIARVVVFDDGGSSAQVLSESYWEKRYQLVQKAIQLGAQEIQLDYIRYSSKQPPSPKNAQDIHRVIKWFKTKLVAQNIPLQIDVFGISCFGDSKYIGQSITLFSDTVDAVCPMVYPSHYEPYRQYAKMPYYAVHSSLRALEKQFKGKVPIKVYPFIEIYNYRYPLSQTEKLDYLAEELKAVNDSATDGWYVWNIHNNYDNLFLVLKAFPQNVKLQKMTVASNVDLSVFVENDKTCSIL